MHKIEISKTIGFGERQKTTPAKSYSVPAEWNELTAQQLLDIAPLYFAEMDKQTFLLTCFAHLFPDRKMLQFFDGEDVLACLPLLEWLGEGITLTRGLFRHHYSFVGPTDNLGNITVGQYITADTCFLQFLKSYEMQDLDSFVNCLFCYKIGGKFSQEKALEKGLGVLKARNFSPNFKYAQVLYWAGCKAELRDLYPHIFPEPIGEPKEGEEVEPTNWGAMLFRVAKTNVFGNFGNLTENEYIHNVFSYLEQEFVEYEHNSRNQHDTEPS